MFAAFTVVLWLRMRKWKIHTKGAKNLPLNAQKLYYVANFLCKKTYYLQNSIVEKHTM